MIIIIKQTLKVQINRKRTSQMRLSDVATETGCLQLEISWNLIGPPGNFCVRYRRSTALVSSHKTGYQIAYL